MKIWTVRLALIVNMFGVIELKFPVYTDEKDFKLIGDMYIAELGFGSVKVPVDLQVSHDFVYGLSVHQGFDHELTEIELIELRICMVNKLKEILEKEKEKYIKGFDEKIKILDAK